MAAILIVDDEEPVRSTIRSILEFGGHDVREATDGEQALTALCERRPDLVLCDITMPRMSGHDVLRELRQDHPQLSDLPFIFLSALAGRGDVVDGLRLGADDYLAKPIDHDVLLAKVEATLRQVSRIDRMRQEEQVKLYKALTRDGSPTPTPTPTPAPAPAPALAPAPAPAPSGGAPATPPPAGDGRARLQEALDAQGLRGSAGKLQFINLSEIKEKLGDKWSRFSGKIIDTAKHIIEAQLPKQAEYRCYDNEVFFLFFPTLNEEEAAIETEKIANEISIKLLGEKEHRYRELSLTSATLAMQALASEGRRPTVTALEHAFNTRAPRQDGRAGNLATRLLDQAVVAYQPLWTPESERVIGYHAACRLPSAAPLPLPQEDDGEGPVHPLISGMDLLTAAKVTADLRAVLQSGRNVMITLPIHFSVLAGPDRAAFVDRLSKVPDRVLQEVLIIEMIPPAGAGDASRIFDALAFLRDRCRFLVLRCGPRHPRITQFIHEGVRSLSLSIADAANGEEPARLYREIRTFARETRSLALQPYVHGLSTLGGVNTAIDAGCRLIAGRAIAGEQDQPGNAFALARNRLVL